MSNERLKDIRMLTVLTHKLGWVMKTEAQTGRKLQSAQLEVHRQLRQVASNIPVTKSGEHD